MELSLSVAEVFLMTWAVLATIAMCYCWSRLKFYFMHGRAVSVLLAEVSCGEIKPYVKDGFTVVENEDIKMSFKKKEEK